MKNCIKCEKEKPLTEFYKHSQMKDRHLNKCKACCKVESTEHRNKNINQVRAYDRRRGNRQPDCYLKDWRDKFPIKYKAITMVGNALRDLKLFKEKCEECESEDKVHAHHDDYSKPLNVRWLCPTCHSKWHVENGEGKNAN